jgi:hypothetical protein
MQLQGLADLVEVTRKEGVPTVKVRFTASGPTRLQLDYRETYVLKDAEGQWLATPQLSSLTHMPRLQSGVKFKAWWKFPAPPPETKKVTVSLPGCEPLEDAPITDAP